MTPQALLHRPLECDVKSGEHQRKVEGIEYQKHSEQPESASITMQGFDSAFYFSCRQHAQAFAQSVASERRLELPNVLVRGNGLLGGWTL